MLIKLVRYRCRREAENKLIVFFKVLSVGTVFKIVVDIDVLEGQNWPCLSY